MDDFFSQYGPYILLGVFLVYLIVFNIIRSNKYKKQEKELFSSIEKGDCIKTYSGFYGTVLKIEDIEATEDREAEKVITISLDEASTMKIDVRAVYQVLGKSKSKNARCAAKNAKTEQ
ncbi:MAG: preprotein translocase subunit YajC [Spirochaetales bacterium]